MSATVPQQQSDLVTVTIDGVAIDVPKGTLLVEAAKQIAVDIPVYCYHTKLGPAGLCRVCLVEIEGMPKLQIACNTPVADGMKVHTRGEKTESGRRAILEFLLINHPLDCPICDKGGECDLQDYAVAYGPGSSRLADAKLSKPKAVDLGPTIVLDEERCIVCQRCVRFDDVITRERSLRTDDRGAHTIIATATGQPYVSDFTGNTTELCPVGALTSKTYRFKSRPWDNHRTTTTCTQCAVGCGMHVDARHGAIARTMMHQEDPVSDGWLCDRGRYNVGFLTDERRLTQPMMRDGDGFSQVAWDDAIATWASRLREAVADRGPGSVAAIGGGRLLNEEAYLFARLHRALGVQNLDHRLGGAVVANAMSDDPAEINHAQVIVTWGQPPSQIAPVLDLRIRAAVAAHGATLFSVGDHAAGSFVPEQRVTIDRLRDAVAALGEGAKRIAMFWDGTLLPEQDAFTALVREWSTQGKELRFYLAGEQPNGRGAEAAGMLPGDGGLDTDGILRAARDGKIAVLAILGANPILHHPDRELVAAALAATPFVVVTELFPTETTAFAHLVLPVCSAFEKSGTTTNFAGAILPVAAAVAAPDGTIADGDVALALAAALGVTLPGLDEIAAEIRARVAEPPAMPRLAAAAPPSGEGLRVVVRRAIATGGGTLAHDAHIVGLRKRAAAWFSPSTAERHGVRPGDLVDLVTAGGQTLRDLPAILDPDAPDGTVGLLGGVPEAPVNGLGVAPYVTVAASRPADVRATLGGAAG